MVSNWTATFESLQVPIPYLFIPVLFVKDRQHHNGAKACTALMGGVQAWAKKLPSSKAEPQKPVAQDLRSRIASAVDALPSSNPPGTLPSTRPIRRLATSMASKQGAMAPSGPPQASSARTPEPKAEKTLAAPAIEQPKSSSEKPGGQRTWSSEAFRDPLHEALVGYSDPSHGCRTMIQQLSAAFCFLWLLPVCL